ncbi:cell division cycle 25 homolog d [Scyliorhinus canicula]|uniref:cell division cycle 25 homolog d n=1 Tax=Scyliorhinus canicula TaxID=7830 RepID=UPI0018F5F056|nr:cell division cycle 25 homolog d [Scyliorhinus canicula]
MSFSPDPPFYPHLHFSPVSSLSFNLNSLSCQESDTPKRRLKLSPESGNPSPEALPVATDTKTPTGQSPNSPCRLKAKNTNQCFPPLTIRKWLQFIFLRPSDGRTGMIEMQILSFSSPYHEALTSLRFWNVLQTAALLAGQFEDLIDEYVIVDCRYPYEYNGGHIKGAVNLYTEEQLIDTFFPRQAASGPRMHCRVIILHCEFSSERGPKFCRNLRRMDRNVNVYPSLCFPELYILKDGYKEFFQEFETFCEPRGYIQMHHKDYREELRSMHRKGRSVARYRRRKELFQTASGH